MKKLRNLIYKNQHRTVKIRTSASLRRPKDKFAKIHKISPEITKQHFTELGLKHFYERVYPYFNIDISSFMEKYYTKKTYGEIIEMIIKKCEWEPSRTDLSIWLKKAGMSAHSPQERRLIAIKKKRISYAKIGKVIHRKMHLRKIDYASTISKKIKTMSSYKYKKGNQAPRPVSVYISNNFYSLLSDNEKRKRLANYLGISYHTIKAWLFKHNKVNAIYWDKVARFLKTNKEKIFNFR